MFVVFRNQKNILLKWYVAITFESNVITKEPTTHNQIEPKIPESPRALIPTIIRALFLIINKTYHLTFLTQSEAPF